MLVFLLKVMLHEPIFVPSARRVQGTMLSCIRVRPYYLLLV